MNYFLGEAKIKSSKISKTFDKYHEKNSKINMSSKKKVFFLFYIISKRYIINSPLNCLYLFDTILKKRFCKK